MSNQAAQRFAPQERNTEINKTEKEREREVFYFFLVEEREVFGFLGLVGSKQPGDQSTEKRERREEDQHLLC